MMGMGFNFITSPDKIESPPPAARSCIENSLVPDLEVESTPSENPSTENSSGMLAPNSKALSAAVTVTVLLGTSFLG